MERCGNHSGPQLHSRPAVVTGGVKPTACCFTCAKWNLVLDLKFSRQSCLQTRIVAWEMATSNDNSHVWLSWDPTSYSEVPGQVPAVEQSRDTSSSLSATEWPLRRYGRFMSGALVAASGSWKILSLSLITKTVLESNKESGFLVLTIVISGHFFISRGKEVLEGFSLIDAPQWLRIVKNADCMLFGSKSKNKHRMFRVQFAGDSKTQAEEHCYSCEQKLVEYVPVQVVEEHRQELQQGHDLQLDDESQLKDAEQNVPVQHTDVNLSPAQGRVSVAELAQYVLTSHSELPLAYQQMMWKSEDLGRFIRLCLLDRSFPAFVEEVEKELKKIAKS
ncbi:meiotic recombination protein REC114 isoform X2 [Hemicordylus capensis]|uniref:meiotic recombination protein REC114 isoform X2 n=1 Tax=Hemicordylus capensis TaxID=884348 RepID=UPI0023036F9C|nr:meiotic recombination protein REC114 isoform X2 [Hemicordylus capensis]